MVIENTDGTDLRFKNPGQLLLVVVAFIFWGVGFIDLIGHTSAKPDVFGLYSLPFFAFILLYGSTIVIWIVLFINSNLLSWVAEGVSLIQKTTWLVLAVFVGIGLALWVIFEWDRWSRTPGLQFSAFGLVLLAGLILLFSNWSEHNGHQWWRKVLGYPLITLVIIEIIIQAVVYLGVLPGIHTIGGNFVPYERIYYNAEGFRNGYANRYGWYFPDFKLNDESKRILMVGGSSIQALQVPAEQQFSPLLTSFTNQVQSSDEQLTEFISIGLPGFGPSPFLSNPILSEINSIVSFDEMVVFYHLGDDFQSPSQSSNSIIYQLNEANKAEVSPGKAKLRHDLTHYYLRGFLSFQIVEVIRSNYLTSKVITGLVSSLVGETQSTLSPPIENEFNFSRLIGIVSKNYSLTEPSHAGIKETKLVNLPEGNNFIFERNGNPGADEAFLITRSILETAQMMAAENDIALRIVTIPDFPEAFYSEYQADDWGPVIGDYDLFLPEKELTEIARDLGIPILAMGQYMAAESLTPEEIKQLYFQDGGGHLTPLGHEYLAWAIYSCFYSETAGDVCPEMHGARDG